MKRTSYKKNKSTIEEININNYEFGDDYDSDYETKEEYINRKEKIKKLSIIMEKLKEFKKLMLVTENMVKMKNINTTYSITNNKETNEKECNKNKEINVNVASMLSSIPKQSKKNIVIVEDTDDEINDNIESKNCHLEKEKEKEKEKTPAG